MTSKLKKMLLISSLILLASCDQGMPDTPEVSDITPIWSGTSTENPQIKKFYGRWMKSGEKIEWSLKDAQVMSISCTDLESRTQTEFYIKQLEKLAEKRCK